MEWDEFGNPLPPRRPEAQEWDEQGRPVRRSQERVWENPGGYSEAAGGAANLAHGLTFGANDQITGAMGGVADLFRPGSVPGVPAVERFMGGYNRESQRTRDYRDQFLADRPNAGNFLQGTGAAVPVIASALAGRPDVGAGIVTRNAARAAVPGYVRPAARGGMGGLAARSTEAGATGASYGFAYGFNTEDEGDLMDRLQAGNAMAGPGALIGAAIPTAAAAGMGTGRWALNNIGRPAWETASNAFGRYSVDPNAVGMSGGNIRRSNTPRPPRPQRPDRMDPVVGGALERLANRSRQTADQLEGRLSEYRLNPQGEVLADAFPTVGVQTLRGMTQTPGQASGRAADVARQRLADQPERILGEFNRRMRVAETPEQALESLNQDYARVSRDVFQPIFSQPITPATRGELMRRFQPYQNDPIMRQAGERAQRIFDRDRANGLVSGDMSDSLPRYLHYHKMGVDAEARWAANPMNGIDATELEGIRTMQRRFRTMLDDSIPGYQGARQQWGGLIEAQDALDEGARLINLNHGAIRQQMGRYSPFARYHARVGFANQLANRIGLRGSVNGNRNVGEVLGSPEMQRRVRAMFDSPEEAANFLDQYGPPARQAGSFPQIGQIGPDQADDFLRTQNQQDVLARNALGWNGGSTTGANQAFAQDNTANTLAQAAIDAGTGRPATAFGRVRNAASLGLVEQANNRISGDLLRRVDNDADFGSQVIAELRRREAERAQQALTARVGGAEAGAESARRRDRR